MYIYIYIYIYIYMYDSIYCIYYILLYIYIYICKFTSYDIYLPAFLQYNIIRRIRNNKYRHGRRSVEYHRNCPRHFSVKNTTPLS